MKIRLVDVKQALLDPRFRESLPEDLAGDVQKFLHNPGCGCNVKIYRKILGQCEEQLRRYFPDRDYESPTQEDRRVAANRWKVINCGCEELESRLKSLGPGRKQVAVARWEDQVTVIVNELDYT